MRGSKSNMVRRIHEMSALKILHNIEKINSPVRVGCERSRRVEPTAVPDDELLSPVVFFVLRADIVARAALGLRAPPVMPRLSALNMADGALAISGGE